MWSYKIIPFLTLCGFLTACGFRPLYPSPGEISDICYPLKIATIPDRGGQILRNYLLDLLTPQGSSPHPLFILEIKLVESIKSIGINKNETTNRMEATLTATIILKDIHTHEVVYTHTTQAINSFAIISQNYYSDVIAAGYAKQQASRLLAEKIKLLISAYFDNLYEN